MWNNNFHSMMQNCVLEIDLLGIVMFIKHYYYLLFLC